MKDVRRKYITVRALLSSQSSAPSQLSKVSMEADSLLEQPWGKKGGILGGRGGQGWDRDPAANDRCPQEPFLPTSNPYAPRTRLGG